MKDYNDRNQNHPDTDFRPVQHGVGQSGSNFFLTGPDEFAFFLDREHLL
jgi:hypothetical protein